MIALIDGDILVYQTAAEKTVWRVNFSFYPTKRKVMEHHPDKEPKPLRYSPTVSAIRSKIDRIIDDIMDKTMADSCVVFLTEPGEASNFRKHLTEGQDLVPGYKANRKDLVKPRYYKRARDHLIDRYKAIEVDGQEADDAIAIMYIKLTDHCKNDVAVMCSPDKDMWTVPGRHYDTFKNEMSWVTAEEAKLWLYRQMLIGDRVDNIPGIHGIGKVKSKKLLENKTEQEMYDIVLNLYKKQYGDEKGEKVLDLVANLLYIRQEEGEKWVRPVKAKSDEERSSMDTGQD